MRLRDLDPKLDGVLADGATLRFDCPLGHPHKIRIPVKAVVEGEEYPGWKATGEFPDTLSLTPSIHAIKAHPNDMDLTEEAWDAAAGCGWHGWITNGEAVGGGIP